MEYHHGNLKDALIHAGEEELKDSGVENLSLRMIAQRAGVSHNAPYRHFKDKKVLVEHIIEKSLTEWADQILSASLLYPASLMMQIQFVGRIYAYTTIKYPQKAHLLMTSRQARHQLILLNIKSLLQANIGREILPSAPIDFLSLHLVAAYRGLCTMHLTQSLDEFFKNDESLIELTDEISENILRPHMT